MSILDLACPFPVTPAFAGPMFLREAPEDDEDDDEEEEDDDESDEEEDEDDEGDGYSE
jgi:ribosomal protein L12E/L44/L45/RPP1/RPP2